MKKALLLLMVLLLTTSLVACNTVSPPKNMSPEKTIEYYFKQFNNRNAAAMQSVSVEELGNMQSTFRTLVYVKVIYCKEESDSTIVRKYFSKEWYPGASDIALVHVAYEICTLDGFVLDTEIRGGDYYLVKDNSNDYWRIVAHGIA
ncbi:MAG: DUF4829 domain-containing protein [Coriobacteriia bacterium]|nr:DUF4829 domain-containing protein [Coriobacteriia bacterium]